MPPKRRPPKRTPREPTTQRGEAYRDDLAYIHDAGFGAFAADAAPWLLELFRSRGLVSGTVVDLGCGSGIWARALADARYDVLGIDISPAMIDIARKRTPSSEFRVGSCLDADLPPCVAVTALGEIFNYLFDEQNTPRQLSSLFRRVHAALQPGGLFVFDVATPGRIPTGHRRSHTVGPDWACLVEAIEDPKTKTLVRHITSFRQQGATYRRDQEVHRLRLYDSTELATELRQIGFKVKTVRSYGATKFPPGYVGFVARNV